MSVTKVVVTKFPEHKRSGRPTLHWDGPGFAGAHRPDLSLSVAGNIWWLSPDKHENAHHTDDYTFRATGDRWVPLDSKSYRLDLVDRDGVKHDAMGSISFRPTDLYKNNNAEEGSRTFSRGGVAMRVHVKWQY